MTTRLLTTLLVAIGTPSSLAQVDTTSIITGTATQYNGAGYPNVCFTDPNRYGVGHVAMNGPRWDNGAWCGAWVEITGAAGTVTVPVLDVCPECGQNNLDLDPTAWSGAVGGLPGIEPISWRWVSAPSNIITGPLVFEAANGSNPFFLEVTPIDAINPVSTLEILVNGVYQTMTRQTNFRFQYSNTQLTEPLTIRATDIFGNEVITSGLTISQMLNEQAASGNFPAIPSNDIVIENAASTTLSAGGNQDFGLSIDGNASSLTFTVKNLGTSTLTGLAVTIGGINSVDFSVTTQPATSLAPSSTTTFTVAFASTTQGTRIAGLQLANSSPIPSLSPYNLDLTGLALSSTTDTDNDNLNDAAEALLSDLGFNWQSSQPDLVNTLFNNANTAGLFTAPQLQALALGQPVISKTNNSFTLTLDAKKSTNLIDFTDFDLTPHSTSINNSGNLEIEFNTNDDTAFFQLLFQ
ncbi:MAG: expansin EXLX1 family cellulose-binding protein [Verrucomicrobiota bacterium]